MADVFSWLQSGKAVSGKKYLSLLERFPKVRCSVTQIVIAVPARITGRSEYESLAAHLTDNRFKPFFLSGLRQLRVGITNHVFIELADLLLKGIAQIHLVVFGQLDARARIFHNGRAIVHARIPCMGKAQGVSYFVCRDKRLT